MRRTVAAALLLGALTGCADTGGDDGSGDEVQPVSAEDSFCAAVEGVVTAQRHPAVRRALRLLAAAPAPATLSAEARAGRRVVRRLARSSGSPAALRADVRALDRAQERQLAAFSGYAVTTCSADPLGGVLPPEDGPSRPATSPSAEAPSHVPTAMPTGLPTEIFTELSAWPTAWPSTGPQEQPSGIPEDMLSAWASMYPSGSAQR